MHPGPGSLASKLRTAKDKRKTNYEKDHPHPSPPYSHLPPLPALRRRTTFYLRVTVRVKLEAFDGQLYGYSDMPFKPEVYLLLSPKPPSTCLGELSNVSTIKTARFLFVRMQGKVPVYELDKIV